MSKIYGKNLPLQPRNLIVNGGLDFWQRGQTFNAITTNAYSADRFWTTTSTGTVNITRQDISSLNLGTTYCLRAERSAGTATWTVGTNLETRDFNRLRGKTVTLSFLIRKGSALTSDVTAQISTRSTEAKNGTVIETASVVVSNANMNTSTFTKAQVSLTVPAASTGLGLQVDFTAASMAGATNAYFEIAQVMLNEGGIAAPFSLAGNDLATELTKCQRFYEKSYDLDTVPGSVTTNGQFYTRAPGATGVDVSVMYRVTKRSTPTVTLYNSQASNDSGVWYDFSTAARRSFSPVQLGVSGFISDGVAGSTTSGIGGHWTAEAEL